MSKKVSEITAQDIAEYLRLSEVSQEDTNFISQCLEISKSYIKNYTGQEELDTIPEFVICIYLLCQDMYDTRTLYVENDKVNKVFDSILGLHCRNYL